MKKYRTCVRYGEDENRYEAAILQASFRLSKTIHCKKEEYRDHMVEKLERLKNEDFNRVLVPEFTYTVDGNDVTYDVQYVKGYGVGTLIPEYAQIIKEDVLNRPNPWTFTDFNSSNFIIELHTNKIFTIDFQSYCYCPNTEERESIWEKYITREKQRRQKFIRLIGNDL